MATGNYPIDLAGWTLVAWSPGRQIWPGGLALAHAVELLPGERGLPGGFRYELKWDGFLH